jgi:hypothetical protein
MPEKKPEPPKNPDPPIRRGPIVPPIQKQR